MAYADEGALTVKANVLDSAYKPTGRRDRPSKTELVLFTRRYKVPAGPLPILGSSRFKL